jgi:hypothetical protein
MLKAVLSWINGLLSLSVPATLSLSSGLPGTSGDDGAVTDRQPSPMDMLTRRLTRAEAFLEVKEFSRARSELQEADRISRRLRPHTPNHERLVARKTELWENLPDSEF